MTLPVVVCLSLAVLLPSLPALAQDTAPGQKASQVQKAQKSKKDKKAAPTPTPTPPAAAPAAIAAPVAVSPGETLAQAQLLYDQLEYDKVAPLAAQALAHPDITLDEKLAAFQLQGAALAIVGDPIEAERPFLLLLSVDPTFDLPKETPPKIRSVFSKVKGEFGAVREAQVRREREALAATIEVTHRLPETLVGGRPLRLEFRVVDPRGAIKSARVAYRRQGDEGFIGLPLTEAERGRWLGAVPGEWTASDTDQVLELTASFLDDTGPLKGLGASDAPLSIQLQAGRVLQEPPVPVWAFVTTASVAGAATVFAAGVTGASAWVGADYQERLARATAENPASGAEIVAQQQLGENLNVAAVVGWAAAGVAISTAVAMALFTNWEAGENEEGEAAAAAPVVASDKVTAAEPKGAGVPAP